MSDPGMVEYVVIILNYKTNDDAKLAIDSVLAAAQRDMHVVLVDVQQEAEWSYAHERVTQLATADNLGYAGGNNIGIKYAAEHLPSRYTFIMNPDVVIAEPGTCEALIDSIDAERELDASIVGGQPLVITGDVAKPLEQVNIRRVADYLDVLLESFAPLRLLFRERYEQMRYMDHVPYSTGIKFHVPAGAFFCMDSKYLSEVLGGFDKDTFLYEEEMMLGYRLREQGKALFFDPEIRVIHSQGVTVEALALPSRFVAQETKKSRAVYLRKYLGVSPVATRFCLMLYDINISMKLLRSRIVSRRG